MRIISGEFKGRKIEGFNLEGTRPTMERVKESLFAMIQERIRESKCLDLFAGSGNLGLEAISQGAKYTCLVDCNKKAFQTIKNNIINLDVESRVKVLNLDFKKAIENLQDFQFDIIFLDPPYESGFDIEALKIIIEQNMLSEEGIIILETDNEKTKKEQLGIMDINVYDLRNYGRVSLFFLNRKEKE